MEFKTVEQISNYVKTKVQVYRQYPSKKELVVKELRVIFDADAEPWKVVIDEGTFRETFARKLGKGGMKALNKLLLELNHKMYKDIDFGIK